MTVREMVVVVLCLLLLAYLFWRFFLYRKSLGPFPPQWRRLLQKHVGFYNRLPISEKRLFEQRVQDFLAHVSITGVEIEVTDLDRLLVAASAIIPIFGFEGWRYRNLNEVLLYSGAFNAEDYQTGAGETDTLGMVGTGAMNRMMILSKPELHLGFRQNRSRNNVGIHEFIHLVDKTDGSTDGVPENLLNEHHIQPWLKLMHREMQAIRRGESVIDDYGGTSEAEFLSVASEYFFQRPERLQEEHPDLYAMLTNLYRQDPATAGKAPSAEDAGAGGSINP